MDNNWQFINKRSFCLIQLIIKVVMKTTLILGTFRNYMETQMGTSKKIMKISFNFRKKEILDTIKGE